MIRKTTTRAFQLFGIALFLLPSLAISQDNLCVKCNANLVSGSEVFVEQTVQTVEYVPQIREQTHLVRYVPARSQTGIGFDVGCAVQAVQAFRDCRSSGGPVIGCLLDGAVTYLSWPGAIVRQRIRQRRARRQARFRTVGFCN